MKRKSSGLTVVELLTVVGIIALLVGLLIPAVSMVHKVARETKQKAHFATIELALTTYKNDFGDYPPSAWTPQPFTGNYCGAQKLAEALVGWDLLGFHPDSEFQADGMNDLPYRAPGMPAPAAPHAYFYYDPTSVRDMDMRKGPYLDTTTASVFRLGNLSLAKPGLFDPARISSTSLALDTFVLCDAFAKRKVVTIGGKIVRAGAPILYYKADPAGRSITEIYRITDNDAIVDLKWQAAGGAHPLGGGPYPSPYANQMQFFYGTADPTDGITGYIQDLKITARTWPYRPDSFILISAGEDGLYGTPDDIKNF